MFQKSMQNITHINNQFNFRLMILHINTNKKWLPLYFIYVFLLKFLYFIFSPMIIKKYLILENKNNNIDKLHVFPNFCQNLITWMVNTKYYK